MLYIASDHAGYELKLQISSDLEANNILFKDLGPYAFDPTDDYVDYAEKVCSTMNKNDLGILICSSGEGMMITANKFKGIYAALCSNSRTAILSRQHNNANVLILSAMDHEKNFVFESIVRPFIETEFTDITRHLKRINRIKIIEDRNFK